MLRSAVAALVAAAFLATTAFAVELRLYSTESFIDVALDSGGNLYGAALSTVPDASGGLWKLTPEGALTQVITSDGDEMGAPLLGAVSVAIAPDDSVYVAGILSHNVFEVTPTGVITEIIDASGDGLGHALTSPRAVASDAAGVIYVTGLASDNAFSISPGGAIQQIIDATGDGVNPLDGAAEVAIDSMGRVFIGGWESDNVFRVDPNSSVTRVLDASGDGTFPLERPYSIHVGSDDRVYVLGVASDNLFEVTSAGGVNQLTTVPSARSMAARPGSRVYVSSNEGVVSRVSESGEKETIVDVRDVNDHAPGLILQSWTGGNVWLGSVNDLYIEARGSTLLYHVSTCENGFDDDADGFIDHPADPGCRSRLGEDEGPACQDGLDNDSDGATDLADPGCTFAWGATESPACDDGVDNDLDGGVDWDGGGVGPSDPDCAPNPHSNSERNVTPDGEIPWYGELSFGIPASRGVSTAVGVAQLFREVAEAPAMLDLGGLTAFADPIVAPVTDPEVTSTIASFRADLPATLGDIVGPITGTGGLTQNVIRVPTLLRVCLILAGCNQSLSFPLTPGATRPNGAPFRLGAAGPIRISAVTYPWTSGPATLISGPTGTGAMTAVDSGFIHRATSVTTTQIPTSGALRLIAPVQVRTKGFDAYPPNGAMFTSLTLRFVPEPDVLFLLVSGCAGLALMGWRRRR